MRPLTRSLTVGSLFAGIGGFDLAAEAMGWVTRWVSEIEPYPCAVLAHHFPNAPNLGDATAIDWSTVERVDVVCGGFPCQPHSVAGKREASADDRDLWVECVRCLRVLRPRYAVFENVAGLLTSESGGFFNRVLSDLAQIGYDAEWFVLSAADVGAPHRRERIWIVAYPDESGRSRRAESHEGRRFSSNVVGSVGNAASVGRGAEGQSCAGQTDTSANVGELDDAEGDRRGVPRGLRRDESAQRHSGASEVVGDGRGWGAGKGVEARRTDAGREPLGESFSRGLARIGGTEGRQAHVAGNVEGLGDTGGAGREECEPTAESGNARHASRECAGILPDWRDGVPFRGADGCVRLIPAGALGDAERGRCSGDVGRRADEESSDGRDELREEAGARVEPTVRALADGVSGDVVRQRTPPRRSSPSRKTKPAASRSSKALGTASSPESPTSARSSVSKKSKKQGKPQLLSLLPEQGSPDE